MIYNNKFWIILNLKFKYFDKKKHQILHGIAPKTIKNGFYVYGSLLL